MKLVSYLTSESLKELSNLCFKCLANKKTVFIQTSTQTISEEISKYFWKLQKFLPNSTEQNEFASIQPIIISDKIFQRNVWINFEGIWYDHKQVKFDLDSFIIWNYPAPSNHFQTYKQSGTKWEVVGNSI